MTIKIRLWVSFDSPHQGATIPTGLQWYIEWLKQLGRDPMSLGYMPPSALFSPAAKQMLVNHINSKQGNWIMGGAPNYYQRFYDAIQQMGFPQNTRKLALINGSFMGITQGNPGDLLVEVDYQIWRNGNYRFRWGKSKIFLSKEVSTSNYTYFFDKQDGGDPSDFKGYLKVDTEFGSYENSPGGLFGHFNINSTLIDNVGWDGIEENGNVNLLLLLFSGIGGWFVLQDFLEDFLGIIAGNNIMKVKINTSDSTFTYIPTKSSLAFMGENKRLDENLCEAYGNLITLHLTPFDSYYAPVENQEHCKLTEGSVQWLLAELQQGPQPPFPDGSLCNEPIIITGPSFLCPGDEATYETNITPDNWSVTNGLNIISSNGNQVIVHNNDAFFGGVITATRQGYIDGYKNVYCLPDFDIIYQNDLLLDLRPNRASFSEQGITDISWEILHGNASLIKADYEGAEVNYSGDYYGQVTVTNDNGSVTKSFFGPDHERCYIFKKIGEDKYEVIDRCDGYRVVDAMPIKEIYDQYGTKLQDAPVINGKLDISNSGNTGEIRIIRVVVNGENLSKRVIKD